DELERDSIEGLGALEEADVAAYADARVGQGRLRRSLLELPGLVPEKDLLAGSTTLRRSRACGPAPVELLGRADEAEPCRAGFRAGPTAGGYGGGGACLAGGAAPSGRGDWAGRCDPAGRR